MANGNANGSDFNIENGPKYPRVKVQLVGPSGFYPTVAAVQAAMRNAGVPEMELSNFYQDVTTGGEDNLLRTCLRWVDVEMR